MGLTLLKTPLKSILQVNQKYFWKRLKFQLRLLKITLFRNMVWGLHRTLSL